MLEAMACALPCVATDVGGNRELVADGVSGYLVPAGDPETAARRILMLLREPHRARQMGQTGRRIVETGFSVEAMIQKLSDLYEDLLVRAKVCGTITPPGVRLTALGGFHGEPGRSANR
jgi:glycosyltransferase involved in cell wall biosynthesis